MGPEYVLSRPAPPQDAATITFDSSLFTSKIFLTQVGAFILSVTASGGINLNWRDPATQLQLIELVGGGLTILFRWLACSGPVSLAGPLTAPANIPVAPGVHVISIPAKEDVHPPLVQPLPLGTSSVTVDPPPAPVTAPVSVTLPK